MIQERSVELLKKEKPFRFQVGKSICVGKRLRASERGKDMLRWGWKRGEDVPARV